MTRDTPRGLIKGIVAKGIVKPLENRKASRAIFVVLFLEMVNVPRGT